MWVEDGILFITYTQDLNVTLEIAKLCVRDRVNFYKNVSYPILADTRTIRSFEKSVRAYLFTLESTEGIKAGAFIIASNIQRVFINFFILINKPLVPSKLFNDREQALTWLKKFK